MEDHFSHIPCNKFTHGLTLRALKVFQGSQNIFNDFKYLRVFEKISRNFEELYAILGNFKIS